MKLYIVTAIGCDDGCREPIAVFTDQAKAADLAERGEWDVEELEADPDIPDVYSACVHADGTVSSTHSYPALTVPEPSLWGPYPPGTQLPVGATAYGRTVEEAVAQAKTLMESQKKKALSAGVIVIEHDLGSEPPVVKEAKNG